jgi:hypothetical protein
VAFRETFRLLDNRIKIFTSLPLATLDRIEVQERLDAIGRTAAAKAGECATPAGRANKSKAVRAAI